MSIEAVDQVLKLGTEVAGTHRMILVVLANYADEDGWSYPKIETIAAKAGIKRKRTVTDSLTWLEDHGYIRRQVNCARGIRGNIPAGKRPNLYQLLFLDGVSESDTAPDRGVSESDRGRGVGKRHPEPSGKNRQENTPTPRESGTNPRANGTNPRAQGTNPRSTGSNPRAAADYESVRQRAIARGWTEEAIAALVRDVKADPTVRSAKSVVAHRLEHDDPPLPGEDKRRPEAKLWAGQDGPEPEPELNMAGIHAARAMLAS